MQSCDRIVAAGIYGEWRIPILVKMSWVLWLVCEVVDNTVVQSMILVSLGFKTVEEVNDDRVSLGSSWQCWRLLLVIPPI